MLWQKIRRNVAVSITNLDFTDYLAIVAEEVDQAEKVLNHLGQEAGGVSLYYNAKAIELQIFNHNTSSENGCYQVHLLNLSLK